MTKMIVDVKRVIVGMMILRLSAVILMMLMMTANRVLGCSKSLGL